MMNPNLWIMKKIREHVQHYNEDKYWRRREIVVDNNSQCLWIIKLYYLYYIKKCDAFNNSSLGTNLGHGAVFKGRPILMHGLYNKIVHCDAVIGKNCTIFQNVTIGSDGRGNVPVIGDDVFIGAGATIIGGIHIGDNVIIGANALVNKSFPANCVVGGPAKIIKYNYSKDSR